MTQFPRYAIYYAAPHLSALGRFGAQMLGYDAWTGEDLPFAENVLQVIPNWHEVTQEPRKYGFHATLKAPFALRQHDKEDKLVAACVGFAGVPRTTPLIEPVIRAISGFVAVVPAQPSKELQQLAADCVSTFDCFRRPLSTEERARRNPQELAPRQRAYLDRWGYPYVMEEFRFHMTLTGRLDAPRRESVVAMLQAAFSKLAIDRLAIDRIVLFRQDEPTSRFRIIGQWPLAKISPQS